MEGTSRQQLDEGGVEGLRRLVHDPVAGALDQAGLKLGVVAEGLAFALARIVLAARGIPFALDGGEAAGIAFGTVGAAVGWAGVGLGVGAIVRVQVGAIVGLLAWMFIAETLLLGLVPSFGRFMPGPDSSSHLLDVLPGGLVLAAWVLALAAAGAALTARRDVG